MPFQMKVQPIDSEAYRESTRTDGTKPLLLKSRLRRLFDRPFRPAEKQPSSGKDGGAAAAELEPSSVCLDRMVQNFIEENIEKQYSAKYSRNRCNCFNGSNDDSSDEEFELAFGSADSVANSSFSDGYDTLKSLIPCESTVERNLLADASRIAEKSKNCKRKTEMRKIVTVGLVELGYNASICKSKWEKSSSYPAGEYEYVDVIVEGERVMIDVDFKSEFEVARSTTKYRAILQLLPLIFVGKADRLRQMVSIVSEAAKQSLKKKGMHVAPWRKTDYMIAKWLSPYTRTSPPPPSELSLTDELYQFDEETEASEKAAGDKEKAAETAPLMWEPPEVKPRGNKAVVVTGLASLLQEEK